MLLGSAQSGDNLVDYELLHNKGDVASPRRTAVTLNFVARMLMQSHEHDRRPEKFLLITHYYNNTSSTYFSTVIITKKYTKLEGFLFCKSLKLRTKVPSFATERALKEENSGVKQLQVTNNNLDQTCAVDVTRFRNQCISLSVTSGCKFTTILHGP